MKTIIQITGQLSGNMILKNAIREYDDQVTKLTFYGYNVTFRTKKEAKKALWEAYRHLKREEPDYRGIRYSKYGALSYDASQAIIID